MKKAAILACVEIVPQEIQETKIVRSPTTQIISNVINALLMTAMTETGLKWKERKKEEDVRKIKI